MSTKSSSPSKGFLYLAAEFIAKGLGTGYSPKAPGTAGSGLGVAFAYLLFTNFPSWPVRIISAIGIVILAYLTIHLYEKGSGRHDDQQVVIDEIAGIFLTYLAVPISVPILIAGFILFRVFDIWKPGPIRWADEKLPGAFGTLLDDVIAGLFSCVLLHVVVYLNWL